MSCLHDSLDERIIRASQLLFQSSHLTRWVVDIQRGRMLDEQLRNNLCLTIGKAPYSMNCRISFIGKLGKPMNWSFDFVAKFRVLAEFHINNSDRNVTLRKVGFEREEDGLRFLKRQPRKLSKDCKDKGLSQVPGYRYISDELRVLIHRIRNCLMVFVICHECSR